MTHTDQKLAVNGYRLPDLVGRSKRAPAPIAELETRRTIGATLVALRDSLDRAGMSGPQIEESLRVRALSWRIVNSVQKSDPGRSVFGLTFAFGYQYLSLAKNRSAFYTWGGDRSCHEEYEAFATARMEYLRTLLDGGNVVFLLGDGCEYIVGHHLARSALREVEQLLDGKSTDKSLLPEDVKDQLRTPVTLEHGAKSSN